MALFDPAFKELIKHEGGYANDPDDHGGETYRGISRNNWRGWSGWAEIDRIKAASQPATLNARLAADTALQTKIMDFYRQYFWMPVMENIQDQALANWLFDKAVNMGTRPACRLLQRALHVDQDGIIGPQTMKQLNTADPIQLLAACREEARRFYTKLALNDPTQTKFLHGWLARA